MESPADHREASRSQAFRQSSGFGSFRSSGRPVRRRPIRTSLPAYSAASTSVQQSQAPSGSADQHAKLPPASGDGARREEQQDEVTELVSRELAERLQQVRRVIGGSFLFRLK